jgi:hypothetical protein
MPESGEQSSSGIEGGWFSGSAGLPEGLRPSSATPKIDFVLLPTHTHPLQRRCTVDKWSNHPVLLPTPGTCYCPRGLRAINHGFSDVHPPAFVLLPTNYRAIDHTEWPFCYVGQSVANL